MVIQIKDGLNVIADAKLNDLDKFQRTFSVALVDDRGRTVEVKNVVFRLDGRHEKLMLERVADQERLGTNLAF